MGCDAGCAQAKAKPDFTPEDRHRKLTSGTRERDVCPRLKHTLSCDTRPRAIACPHAMAPLARSTSPTTHCLSVAPRSRGATQWLPATPASSPRRRPPRPRPRLRTPPSNGLALPSDSVRRAHITGLSGELQPDVSFQRPTSSPARTPASVPAGGGLPPLSHSPSSTLGFRAQDGLSWLAQIRRDMPLLRPTAPSASVPLVACSSTDPPDSIRSSRVRCFTTALRQPLGSVDLGWT